MLTTGAIIADRFVVEKVLGEGGIARVYRVRHRQLGTLHALKMLTLQREKMSERLLLEGRIQARLRHPNVVAVTDVLSIDGRPALLMEFVDGASMEGWLRQNPEITLLEALSLFAQILAGVHAAHLQGVLHRDLKPANVLLSAGPGGVIAKVSDFGIAKVAMDEQKTGFTATGVPMGTPGYMAPEQFTDSAAADSRSDIFALGVMLYELVTGRQPFLHGDLLKILNATATGSYVPTDQLVPGLPVHLVEAIRRAMSPDPAHRFPDCAAMALAVFAENGPLLQQVLQPGAAPTPLKLAGVSGTSTVMMPSLTDDLESSTGQLSSATNVPMPSMQGPQTPLPVRSPTPPVAAAAALEEEQRPFPIWLAALVGMAVVLGGGAVWWVSQQSESATEAGPDERSAAAPQPADDRSPAAPPKAPTEPPEQGEDDDQARAGQTRAERDGKTETPPAAEVRREPTPEETARAAEAPPEEVAEPVAEQEDPPAEAPPEEDPPEDAVVEVEPPEEDPPSESPPPSSVPSLNGTWRGEANRRPIVLVLSSTGDGAVSGSILFPGGSAARTIPLTGRIDAAGQLGLQEPGGQGLILSGTLSGGTLTGAYSRAGQGSTQSWTATRE